MSSQPEPNTPPEGFWFIAWSDPPVDGGFDADSDRMIELNCPKLGPTATLILHRIARQLRTQRWVWWDLAELAPLFGLGHVGDAIGTNHPVRKAINRLLKFGYMRQMVGYPELIEVRTVIPPLSPRRIDQLPASLRDSATTQ